MGMFYYIRCEMALPPQPAPPRDLSFQTKNTPGQFLERCTITAGGRLIHHVVEYIEVLPNQRPYPNTPGLRCVGSKRASLVGDLDTGFHGTIKFYR
jgi:hypothetical protein